MEYWNGRNSNESPYTLSPVAMEEQGMKLQNVAVDQSGFIDNVMQ